MTYHRILLVSAFCISLFSWSLAAQAQAGSSDGLPRTLSVDGTSLTLNGSAYRKKLFIKVYQLGVYLPQRQSDAGAIIRSSGPKALRMRLLIPLDGDTIGESIARGFKRNDSHRMKQLSKRLDRLKGMFPKTRRGDELLFLWSPSEGTVIEHQGRRLGTIAGKDFSDALFSVWLGPVTSDAKMKERLLGGKKGRSR